MIYLNPTLILFGGSNEKETLNDFWILNTDKTPFQWINIDPIGERPIPRVYHTANLFKYYHNEEMIVILGGRDHKNNSLSDFVGVRKNIHKEWEWCFFSENLSSKTTKTSDCKNNIYEDKSKLNFNKINVQSKGSENIKKSNNLQNLNTIINKKIANNQSDEQTLKNNITINLKREQHSCTFIGPFLFVVGGRSYTIEKSRFDVFSMISLKWYNFGKLDFYRHTVWGFQNIKTVDEYDIFLFIYGGFIGENSKLNNNFIRIDVIELFSSIEILNNELDEYINNVISLEKEKNEKLKNVKIDNEYLSKAKETIIITKKNEAAHFQKIFSMNDMYNIKNELNKKIKGKSNRSVDKLKINNVNYTNSKEKFQNIPKEVLIKCKAY